MSLYSKLGPQGRRLLDSSGNVGPGVPGGPGLGQDTQETPQELDFLIEDLRNPKPDMTLNKVLGYMYHYLPRIKVEYNLRLVFASFLNNPTCFGPRGAPFETNYMIIEGFKSITDKKLSMSQPTISVKTWYKVILQELIHFCEYNPLHNSWKVLPIISGITLSNQLRDDLYTNFNILEYKWFFSDWDSQIHQLYIKSLNFSLAAYNSDDIINLTLLSYSITFKHDRESVKDYTPKTLNHFIINKLTQLIFSNSPFGCQVYEKLLAGGEDVMNKPVIKHLNRLSFLLEGYYQILPLEPKSFDLITDNLTNIKLFNQRLSQLTQTSIFNTNLSQKLDNPLHQQFWLLMKSIFFGQCIIYQGIYTRFLRANNKGFKFQIFRNSYNIEYEYRQISFKVLESSYYLNHVLLSIGQGGFDSYNFIYYLCLEILLAEKNSVDEFEKFTMYLIGYPNVNLNSTVLNQDLIIRSKVLFVLGLWENYLQSQITNNDFAISNIFTLCFDIVNDKAIESHELIEACHSVLLFCFSKNTKHDNFNEMMEYVDLVISQFPMILSPNQLSIALETLGKKMLSKQVVPEPLSTQPRMAINPGEEFLNYIYFKCLHTRSGIPIKANTESFQSAQPISEIGAESTLRTLDTKHTDSDIIRDNKRKKPKNQIMLDMMPDSAKSTYKFQKRLIPETSKEALVMSLINLVPYLPLSIFVRWLDKIMMLIDGSNVSERAYMIDVLWKVLSENLDLNRGELAYRWWYNTKKAVAVDLIRPIIRQEDLKL